MIDQMNFPTGSFSVTKASKVATESLRRPASAGRRFFVCRERVALTAVRDIGD
jgi:hypothetical protein